MTAGGQSTWSCTHTGPGGFDESARRVGHAELAVAELLAGEGHQVKSLPEGRGPGRKADFLACGVLVEAKSFRPLSERDGRVPSAQSVANKILDASRQGAVVVIWAVGSGLAEQTARSGYFMFCQRAELQGLGRLRAVRVVGESFEVNFDPLADLSARWRARSRPGIASAGERLPRPRPSPRPGGPQRPPARLGAPGLPATARPELLVPRLHRA